PAAVVVFLFFFQAEDGIRARNVTGVQTCALPICCSGTRLTTGSSMMSTLGRRTTARANATVCRCSWVRSPGTESRISDSPIVAIDRKSVVEGKSGGVGVGGRGEKKEDRRMV